MNSKLYKITDLRWGLIGYTAGSGIHLGCGDERIWPNAVGIDDHRTETTDLTMQLDALPLFADECFDFVVAGDVFKRVHSPRKTLDEAWRVLNPEGFMILIHPTESVSGWVAESTKDFVRFPVLTFGAKRVDVFQKLAAGAGQHVIPAVETEKTVSVMRPGGFGDALWASSILPALKAEGYHITVYTGQEGEQVLRHDPNIDAMVVTDDVRLQANEIGGFYRHEWERYDRFVNLVESVEKNLLATPIDMRFFWPASERRRVFNRSYIEAVHDLAGVPRKYAQRFFPTASEVAQAELRRAGCAKVAVVTGSGSTMPKFWPYLDELADGLIARGYDVFMLGDMRTAVLRPRQGLTVVGTQWPIREALAFSQLADVVIGQETVITNAVALEKMRKVVLLSHSTVKNLTSHWVNTVGLNGTPACWPCHQIHYQQKGWFHCNKDEKTGTAKCQATITPQAVLAAVDRAFVIRAAA